MTRYAAFLRAVNVGRRRVAMARCCELLRGLGYSGVASFLNSGNLLFSAAGPAREHEQAIRAALEAEYGFEIATFVRSAEQVRSLATEQPFGPVAEGHTHFVLLALNALTEADEQRVVGMSNDHDETAVIGGDVHWLILSKSTDTTLGSVQWRRALPDNPTTARNVTMMRKLAARL